MNKRIVILISILILVSVIAVFDIVDNFNSQIKILDIKVMKITKSWLPFYFENSYHERLIELRSRENLDEVVRPAGTEFEKILLLKDWTRRQWESQDFPFPYPPWDALIILDWIRGGKTTGFCVQYAVVYAQSLQSLGIPVRYLDIESQSRKGHFLTEVWSKDYNKWVVMDPYFDIHFEKDNIPLNALELHNVACDKKYGNINVVKGPYIQNKDYNRKSLIDYYYIFRIMQKNNQLTNPVAISLIEKENLTIVKLTEDLLQWDDSFTRPYILKRYISSSNLNDFYFKPDIIITKVVNSNHRKGEIVLEFKQLFEENQYFLIIRDGDEEWTRITNPFVWKLDKGYNKLYVSPEKSSPDEGSVQSYIAVEY